MERVERENRKVYSEYINYSYKLTVERPKLIHIMNAKEI